MADTLNFFQQALWLAIIMSGPPLVVATVLGLLVSLVQAVTQIQDQTLPYVVKLVAVAVTVGVLGRWFGSELAELTDLAFNLIARAGH